MSIPEVFLITAAVIAGAFLLGGLLSGIDRRITARLQGRMGPPLLQPFYDVIKLLGKERFVSSSFQVFYVLTYLFASVLALVLFVFGQDLILIILILTVGGGSLVLGALTSRSPYSQVGSQREILQMLSYEPVLFLVAIGMYLTVGSFKVGDIVQAQQAAGEPLLFSLPFLFLALLLALTIKMRKSPYDISASHHAHQEIVRGVMTEYSGPYLALVEIAHWFELLLILAMVGLFVAHSWTIMLLVIILAFLAELLIDNVAARLTWKWMVKSTWAAVIILAVANYFFWNFKA